jgi:DNA-binding MarR family transcriptional regulator
MIKEDNIRPPHMPKHGVIQRLAEHVPGVDPDAVATCLMMVHVTADIRYAFDAHFARHGLSRGRFMVLMMLYTDPGDGLSPAQIAARIEVTRATMTGLLDGLEAMKFVSRQPDDSDRRRVRICLTEDGGVFLERMLPDHFRRVAALMDGLTGDERSELRRLMNKMKDGVDAVREP